MQFENLTGRMIERLAQALRPWFTGQTETALIQFGDRVVGASLEQITPRIDNLQDSLAAGTGSELVGFIQSGTGAVARTVQDKLSEFVSPEDYFTADTPVAWTESVRNALTRAGAIGATVRLNRIYPFCGEMVVPSGVTVTGSRSTGFRRINQVTTTTTSGISSGSGIKTFTVSSAAGFEVGQSVLFVLSSSSIQPLDPYMHRNPVITAISGNSITIDPRSSLSAIPSGATMATMTQCLVLRENCTVDGFTLDGNATNNTYVDWRTGGEIICEENDAHVSRLAFKDTPTDAALVSGPSGGLRYRATFLNCDFADIGGNAIHSGNYYDIKVIGGNAVGCNLRYANNANAGGNVGASGHNDGFYSLSNDTGRLLIDGVRIERALKVLDQDTSNPGTFVDNDRVIVANCQIKNVSVPLYCGILSREVLWSNNRVEYDYGTSYYGNSHCSMQVIGDASNNPARVIISGGSMRNVQTSINYAIGVYVGGGITIDNTAITAATPTGVSAIDIRNASDVTLGDFAIYGGLNGVYLQNNNVDAKFCKNISMEGAWKMVGQSSGGVIHDGNSHDLKISGGTVESLSGASSSYVGVDLPAGATMQGTKFKIAAGIAYKGVSRRVQNAFGHIVNGVISTAIANYVSQYVAFIAAADGSVSNLVSNVYSVTNVSGAAATWTRIAHTGGYSDQDFEIRIVPKVSDGTFRAWAGVADVDPTTLPTSGAAVLTGGDYGFTFWSGTACVTEISNNRTALTAYAANDVFWVYRRSGTIKYAKGGATPEGGTLLFTSTTGANEKDNLYGLVSANNGTGAIEVRMFG